MATFDLIWRLRAPRTDAAKPGALIGFKPEIDGQGWLVKEVTHSLDGNGGLTSKVQMERGADNEEDKPSRDSAGISRDILYA